MNILKLKVSANECTWLPADKVEFIDVVDANTVDLRCLGTYDDLAHDEVAITASLKSSEVAEVLAGHIQNQRGSVLDVAAISGVTSIAALVAK